MTKYSQHAEWLRLIDVVGSFLTPNVLEEAFPQGLDAIDGGLSLNTARKDAKIAFNEWRDAVDEENPRLQEYQKAWVEFVLQRVLDFDAAQMASDVKTFEVQSDEGLERFSPDYVLKDGDGKPIFFIKAYPHRVKLNAKTQNASWNVSPLDKMTKLCRVHNVRIGLVTNGNDWTLVNAPNGQPSGYATWEALRWFDEPLTYRAFQTLLSCRRFFYDEANRLPALLDRSFENMGEITDALGSQVRAAIEVLIQGINKADADRDRDLLRDVSPRTLYEAGLTVMMRLVFILCAEERGLLLLGTNLYDGYYAVSTLRDQLATDRDNYGEEVLERRHDAWTRLLTTFRMVYAGSDYENLRLPALGGSIFDPDKYPFLEGRKTGTSWKTNMAQPLPIDNRTVLLLLESLQILKQKGGATFLSYRGLDVEQIGYIYEGLLEQTAVQTKKVTLGLIGSNNAKNPIISLDELLTLKFESEDKLFERVKDVTKRSLTSIKSAYLKKEPDPLVVDRLVTACDGKTDIANQIKPFANWLRKDAWELPVVYLEGDYMVTLGQDRRDTGTHYTPRNLAEDIVKTTLEPIVYVGPALGWERKEWKLKSAEELLNLKICDPAMGSGAFLVQVIRYLGDRLVEAWNHAEEQGKFVDSEGVVGDDFTKEPISNVVDDRIAAARSLVAERCVYGVDVNPLAVELAKLSLWLVTISKGKPFSFLDHNLKSGDSLLGINDVRQLYELKRVPDGGVFNREWKEQVQENVMRASELRDSIRRTVVRDIENVKVQNERNDECRRSLERLTIVADKFVATMLNHAGSEDKLREKLSSLVGFASSVFDPNADVAAIRRDVQKELDVDLPKEKDSRRPFHWALEFPEVFQQGGFDAICGNPPFNGGTHISGIFGIAYRNFLFKYVANGIKGNRADLVAYFYLRTYDMLRSNGLLGLIACNTIAEGDTRQTGLEQLLFHGASIIASYPNLPWPGLAAVSISPTFITKGAQWKGNRYIHKKKVSLISAFLTEHDEWTPKILEQNKHQTYLGSYRLGMGFSISEEKALSLIEKDTRYKIVLTPYLIGDDLNSSPDQTNSSWTINFWDWPLKREKDKQDHLLSRNEIMEQEGVPTNYNGLVASDFPLLLDIVEEKVKPERLKKTEEFHDKWWLFWRPRSELYHSIGRGKYFSKPLEQYEKAYCSHVVVTSRHTRYFIPSPVENKYIFSDSIVVFVTRQPYPILASSIFQDWSWKQGSRLGAVTLRFNPSDCFETFPFPQNSNSKIQQIGNQYYGIRNALMRKEKQCLTDLYNRFHSPEESDDELNQLRALQRQLDEAVKESYGWTDIDLNHGFHEVGYLVEGDNVRYTISEPARIEILRRLSQLNKQYWEEEQKEAVSKKGKSKK